SATSSLFPYTTLFRSGFGVPPGRKGAEYPLGSGNEAVEARVRELAAHDPELLARSLHSSSPVRSRGCYSAAAAGFAVWNWCASVESPSAVVSDVPPVIARSEEHTSELQSRENLVC